MSKNWFNSCGRFSRRNFLTDCGMGFTGLALGAMQAHESIAKATTRTPPTGKPHFAPKVKNVIWYFMLGGTSHMESFDPKPELNRYAGRTLAETPYGDAVLNSPYYRKNVRDFNGELRNLMPKIFPMQTGYQRHGQSGIAISDWWPHLAKHIDDLAIVRSMWTTDNDHAAQLQFHTGHHIFEGFHPSIGSWVNYALGSLNDNLPQFIVLGQPPSDCCGGVGAHGGSYLGPEHSGVPMKIDPANPLPFGTPGPSVTREERAGQMGLLRELNDLVGVQYPEDAAMRARIKAYELAARMQLAVPEVMKIDEESEATKKLYGMDQSATKRIGQQSLIARRLVEQGVRFVQIYDGGWDAHTKLKENHSTHIAGVDKPIASLLQDLKQRGLLDETLVVWGTEFGRTPGAERSDGRDHHPYGFSIWLAGGGIKGGMTHGATDELGFHAVENRHYVTDLHATVLHQLGLDSHRLELPDHKRRDIDFGNPIREIMA